GSAAGVHEDTGAGGFEKVLSGGDQPLVRRPRRRGRGATPRPQHVSVLAAQGESRRNELALQLQRFDLVQRRLQRLRRAVQVERISDYSQKRSEERRVG